MLLSLLGGLLIGFAYYLTITYTAGYKPLAMSPPQFPLIIFGGIGGLLGSVIDSVLGATLQFSGEFRIV